MANKHIGSNFDDFLEDEGLLAEAQATAVSRVLAFQLEQFIKDKQLSKTAAARELNTSRSALDRLIDPKNTSINLSTMAKMAEMMGKKLHVSLV